MTERQIPIITKDGMHQIIDSVYNNREMQMFISIMVHAQTCKDCSPLFHEAIEKAKHHMASELI